MESLTNLAHWFSGCIVLAEALNKLERTAPFKSGLTPRQRVVDGLKALAWALLALGAAGAVITPFLLPTGMVGAVIVPLFQLERPTLQDACVLVGFAVLIVRTRIKEG